MLVFFTNSIHGISGRLFSLIFSFPSNRRPWVVLDGNSTQEYPDNAGFPQGSILDPKLSLLYINNLPDYPICNIAVYVEDTTLYSVQSGIWLVATRDWFQCWKILLVATDRSNNCSPVNIKINGSNLDDELFLKMLWFSSPSKLDWGFYRVCTAKTASKKIRALKLFYEVSFFWFCFLSPQIYHMIVPRALLSWLGWCS